MEEFRIKGINYFNPLEGKIDKIIEYFVKFYGEKYRERIENKIKNTTFIFVPDLANPFRSVSRTLEKLQENTEEDKPKEFKDRLKEGSLLGIFDNKNTDERIIKIKSYEKELKEWENEFDERIIDLFKKIFPQSKIDKYCFDKYERLLDKGKENLSKFNKFQQDDLLELAQKLGYDYGKDFSALISDKKIIDKIFDENLKDIYKEEKRVLINQKLKSEFLKDILSTISKINRKDGNLDMVENFYEIAFGGVRAPGGFAQTYLDKNNNPKSFVCLSIGILDAINSKLIHEINHIIETEIFDINEKGFVEKSGFDVLNIENNNKDFNGINAFDESESVDYIVYENRKYEALNEAINDYIAQKICKLMEEDGFEISIETEWESSADYRFGFMFVKDIVDEHLDKIIEWRFSKDPNAMAKVIGQENFDKWAEIVNEWTMKSKKNLPQEVKDFINQLNEIIFIKTENLDEDELY